jgi:hypothetical protein
MSSEPAFIPLVDAWTSSPDAVFPRLCAALLPFARKFGFVSILSQSEWEQEIRLIALKCLEAYDPALGDFLALFKATWKNHVYSLARRYARAQRFVPVNHWTLERLSFAQRVPVSYSVSLVPLATRSFTKSIRIH